MCGIAGRLNFDATRQVDADHLAAMTAILAHRGPDGSGFYRADNVGLGHRRLSIIDLATGDQPLANEDQSIWVVFNGEIYNFADLRCELEAAGHRFRTRSDTEVIVHGYEEWGAAAVERFRGMFAFALWDRPRRRLVLARDRVGIKPLYYSVTSHGLTFGSEIKAVLQDPDVSREWSPEAIDAYLTLQYVPTPHTIYKEIRKLPPGHVLIAEPDRIQIRQYWDLTFTGEATSASEDELLDRLDALVTESVRLRLLSDVPLGAFLSGGIDSSLVVATMAQTSRSRVVTTTVGFNERGFDEVAYARAVAHHLATESHERIVTPDIADILPRLAWHLDEPFADSSAVPTYYVSAAAREHVTVALSGDGGDELWAGYPWHRVERWEHRARRLVGVAGGHALARLGQWLPLGVKGARSLRHLALKPAEACARKHAYEQFEGTIRRHVYTGDFAHAVRDVDHFARFRRLYESCPSPDPLDRTLYVDVKTYLADDILMKVDKMSMAVSLEARVPLLDHKLLEFAATIPTALKLRRGRSKYLLKRLLERRVPRSIVDRPKQGFRAPVGEWLRGPLAPMVEDLLAAPRLKQRGILNPAAVQDLWREHRTGAADHRHRLWSLVMLELWFRQFADGPIRRPTAEAAAA